MRSAVGRNVMIWGGVDDEELTWDTVWRGKAPGLKSTRKHMGMEMNMEMKTNPEMEMEMDMNPEMDMEMNQEMNPEMDMEMEMEMKPEMDMEMEMGMVRG